MDPTKRVVLFVSLVVLLLATVVYFITLTPTVPFWDSGEYIATSRILGLPHPPGNPVYTMLGRIMTLVPIASIAWRVNFLSALASALTCFFTYLVVVRTLRRTFQDRFESGATWLACLVGGLTASFFVAFSGSFWDSAIEAEVYSLSSALIAFTMWLAFRWWDRLDQPGAMLGCSEARVDLNEDGERGEHPGQRVSAEAHPYTHTHCGRILGAGAKASRRQG